MENKKEFGLIGYPLGHSYSKVYFTEKFRSLGIDNASYQTFPLSDIGKMHNLVKSHKNLVGLNVTTPYKEIVIPYLNEVDASVLKIGTVNAISIFRNEESYHMKGYNTDVDGLRKLFSGFNFSGIEKALILGSGGSGKTTAFVLKEMGIHCRFVSRHPSGNETVSYTSLNAKLMADNLLIVNASPVGMHPLSYNFPDIPYEYISEKHTCIDLVYNPEITEFIKKCREKGAQTANGTVMLYEQADKAWEVWQRDVF
ncbi:MAG: shikimate dehydrogenase [Bacteroidales bacterium]|nr:shikimate dehydrogenase [Bacteroidales bacterium]HOY39208.1 shikimate dehydrogenase [Bacteroidales bacterium]HQN92827.1 shikimate dehydrogenase [Prolixibacteraceae bacterium]